MRRGSSLAVQWLGLGDFIAMTPGSIPGRGTKILQIARCGPPCPKKERKQKKVVKVKNKFKQMKKRVENTKSPFHTPA